MQIADLQQWLQQRLPAPFAAQPPEIRMYSDEVVIMLQADTAPRDDDAQDQHEADLAWIVQQREETRTQRMELASELQHKLHKPVAWGMRAGSGEMLFTTRTVPVMTRLGRAEREVLDTLVAAGVAETRSAALAYTVRAFAIQHSDWLAEVRQAIGQVQQIRSRLKVKPQAGAPLVPQQTTTSVRHSADDSDADEG